MERTVAGNVPPGGNAPIVVIDTFWRTYVDRLLARFPDIVFRGAETAAAALPLVGDAVAVFALAPMLDDAVIAAAPRLRWIQALTSGVDTFDAMPSLTDEVVLTSARGVHGPQVSEMAFLHMLVAARDFPRMMRNQATERWDRWPQRLLWRRTVTIVGVGIIAEDLAVRCRAFGMRVLGVSGTPREVPGFDRLYPRAKLHAALGEADFVVLLAPSSAANRHMIDAAALRAMRRDAVLINVARGGVVDEAALLRALDEGWIAGAGLDVFAEEPLPAGDPLWRAPGTVVTPHMGGMSDCYEEQVMPLVERNLAAFLAGRIDEMENRVWKQASAPASLAGAA